MGGELGEPPVQSRLEPGSFIAAKDAEGRQGNYGNPVLLCVFAPLRDAAGISISRQGAKALRIAASDELAGLVFRRARRVVVVQIVTPSVGALGGELSSPNAPQSLRSELPIR
ncbi:hypothetical protein I41_17550 [Lacipirellula limnantheis]|uniref:Uncharacterized protein n=1 Tax=Lacipirellula limnantheis TaxID=2528024 RepID=A0A517TW26_9BACT|nr:hypothetical protein I41_17550 [Lacipirellula limnantheis]